MRYASTPLILSALAALLAGCTGGAQAPRGASMITDVRKSEWQGGQRLATSHYNVFTTSSNQSLLTYMPGFMEAAYENYRALTGLPARADEPAMPIYLMGTRQEWAALTGKIVGPAAPTYLSIEAGGYCYEGVCVFWDIGGLSTFSIASHEGMHQFLHCHLKDQLPAWLDEGLAVSSEGYNIVGDKVTFTPGRNPSRFNSLREAIVQQRWIATEKLLPLNAGDVVGRSTEEAVGYYGQLWALVQFLKSRPDYRDGLARLLADAEAGRLNVALKMSAPAMANLRVFGQAYNRKLSLPIFQAYITADMPAFERDYKAFAGKLAGL